MKHILFSFSLYGDEGSWCSYVGFMLVLLFLVYLCLNFCIALNLQLVILQSRTPTRKWEGCYWAFSLVMPLVLTLPLLGNAEHADLFKNKP